MSYSPPESSIICGNHRPEEEEANAAWLIQTEAPYAISFGQRFTSGVDLSMGIWIPTPATPNELAEIAGVMCREHRRRFQQFAGLGMRHRFETWNYHSIPESKVPTLFFVSSFCSSVYNRHTKQSWREVFCDPEMRLYFDPNAPEDVVAFYREYQDLPDDLDIVPPVPMPTSRNTGSGGKLKKSQIVYNITWTGEDGKIQSMWAEDIVEMADSFELKKVRASNADLQPSDSVITMATHRIPFEGENLTIMKTADPVISAIHHPPSWWNQTSPDSFFL